MIRTLLFFLVSALAFAGNNITPQWTAVGEMATLQRKTSSLESASLRELTQSKDVLFQHQKMLTPCFEK